LRLFQTPRLVVPPHDARIVTGSDGKCFLARALRGHRKQSTARKTHSVATLPGFQQGRAELFLNPSAFEPSFSQLPQTYKTSVGYPLRSTPANRSSSSSTPTKGWTSS